MFRVSKIANAGHWLLAGLIAVDGAFHIGHGIVSIIHDARTGQGVASLVASSFWEFAAIALLFAVVRGVLTWANWAHALLVLLCGLAVFAIAVGMASGQFHDHIAPGILTLVLCCAGLVWLLLPSVRGEYWRRERVA